MFRSVTIGGSSARTRTFSAFSAFMPHTPQIPTMCGLRHGAVGTAIFRRDLPCREKPLLTAPARTRMYSSTAGANFAFAADTGTGTGAGRDGGVGSPVSRKKKKAAAADAADAAANTTTSSSSSSGGSGSGPQKQIAAPKHWRAIAQDGMNMVEAALGTYVVS